MTSLIGPVIRISVCVGAALAAPLSFGAAADRPLADAQLLDRAAFLCSNCFFGPSTYYYCFAVEQRILIGYQRTPVLNWEDKSKNYLTSIHSNWTAWTAPGQTVPIRYDAKHIWIPRAEGKPTSHGFIADLKATGKWVSHDNSKEVKLTRISKGDIFTNERRCRQAEDKSALARVPTHTP
jgi:hypothetical protein